MARIPLLDENDPALTAEQHSALAAARSARGRLLNIHRAMANRPAASHAVQGLIRAVYREGSSLDVKHGELAYLTATAVNDCFY